MRIKLDENLPIELADELRTAGHDADTVVSERLGGEPDHIVADAANRSRRVLFTLDKGLGDAREFPPSAHHGIVVFRLAARGRQNVCRAIVSALRGLTRRRSLTGRLVVVTESSMRLRS